MSAAPAARAVSTGAGAPGARVDAGDGFRARDDDEPGTIDVRDTPLSGGPLTRAALAGSAPPEWYAARPASADAWRREIDAVRARYAGRDWLAAAAPAFDASGAAAERLARAAGSGVVVTTGQQPGLFGGPLYTWHKALTALALADAIQAATGTPTAPVFWAATDDSDFAEASITHVAVPGGLETLQMPSPASLGASMRDTPLGDVRAFLRVLERGAGSASYGDALEAARRAYQPAETVGSAYLVLLRALLEPLGIAVLDAAHPAVRRAARPLLVEALRRAGPLESALLRRAEELRGAGFEPQVETVRGLTLVFGSERGVRQRIKSGDGEALAAELDADRDATAARGDALDLGPNVLLRPVVERSVVPTVSYVAGPGEVAYFAQVSAVADTLDQPAPVVVPRWSGVIVEPHIRRILASLGLDVEDLRDPHAAEGRLAREMLPPEAAQAIARAREVLAGELAHLGQALAGGADALVPAAVTDGVGRDVLFRLQRLERRVVAAQKRRLDGRARDISTARAALFPLGKPQERVLNGIPLLARHGPALFDAVLAHARRHAAALCGAETE